jgi:hypothetical protein
MIMISVQTIRHPAAGGPVSTVGAQIVAQSPIIVKKAPSPAVQILGVVLLAKASKRISAAPVHPETWGRVYGDAAYRPYGDFDSRGSFPVLTAEVQPFPDRAVCPTCGTRYDPRGARFCARDGTELRAVR